jgi:N-acetylglutamate synthase-like GNAT family acetyltransferase
MSTTLRTGQKADLPDINGVIERAVMAWRLPERVKRLSLPLYRYGALDLDHLDVRVADTGDGIAGVAAWEPADPADVPEGSSGLLLHGLYVDPARQGEGHGTRLLEACLGQARELGLDGVLVRAQADAEAFFRARGLERLPVHDASRDYALRYWQRV